MLKEIAYGRESKDPNSWYVQGACKEVHRGQECACKTFFENLSEDDAKFKAEQLALAHDVDAVRW